MSTAPTPTPPTPPRERKKGPRIDVQQLAHSIAVLAVRDRNKDRLLDELIRAVELQQHQIEELERRISKGAAR